MKTGFLVLFSYSDVQKQWKVFRFHNEVFKHSSNSSEFHTVLSRMVRWRSITVGCLCFYTLSQTSCTNHYPKKATESGAFWSGSVWLVKGTREALSAYLHWCLTFKKGLLEAPVDFTVVYTWGRSTDLKMNFNILYSMQSPPLLPNGSTKGKHHEAFLPW